MTENRLRSWLSWKTQFRCKRYDMQSVGQSVRWMSEADLRIDSSADLRHHYSYSNYKPRNCTTPNVGRNYEHLIHGDPQFQIDFCKFVTQHYHKSKWPSSHHPVIVTLQALRCSRTFTSTSMAQTTVPACDVRSLSASSSKRQNVLSIHNITSASHRRYQACRPTLSNATSGFNDRNSLRLPSTLPRTSVVPSNEATVDIDRRLRAQHDQRQRTSYSRHSWTVVGVPVYSGKLIEIFNSSTFYIVIIQAVLFPFALDTATTSPTPSVSVRRTRRFTSVNAITSRSSRHLLWQRHWHYQDLNDIQTVFVSHMFYFKSYYVIICRYCRLIGLHHLSRIFALVACYWHTYFQPSVCAPLTCASTYWTCILPRLQC